MHSLSVTRVGMKASVVMSRESKILYGYKISCSAKNTLRL